jgi:hypothetical protein
MTSPNFSDEDIERAMGFVAWIIELYGDEYWPIFERLEDELRARKERQSKLQAYLSYHQDRSTKPERHEPGTSKSSRKLQSSKNVSPFR